MANSGVMRQIFSRKMLNCIFIGFSSGLPLYVLFTFLPYWLRKEHIDLKTIGLFTLIGFPYTWKFIWAPLLDRFQLPWLGRRRGWIILLQGILFAGILSFGWLNPQQNITLIAILASLVAFFSATQDIVLDAYRREILDENEMGLGNSIYVNAYRLSGLIPGSLSIFLTSYYTWSSVFFITALFMLPGIFATLFLFLENTQPSGTSRMLRDTIIQPFTEYYQRKGGKGMFLVLAFLCLYKLGDSMATALMTPFYIDMGYNATDIALVAKNATLWPLLISSVIGGIIMLRIGINRALWLFGGVQILTLLGFVWLSHFGKFEHIGTFELVALAMVLAGEYIGVGLGTTAFVAFITRETNPLYTATQFALFTSLTGLPRTLLGSSTGYLIDQMGYYNFYWLCFFLAIPGMLLLYKVVPWNGDRLNLSENQR